MVDISSVVFHFTFSLYDIKLSVVREHTVLPYEIRLHIRLTCGRPGTCQNI